MSMTLFSKGKKAFLYRFIIVLVMFLYRSDRGAGKYVLDETFEPPLLEGQGGEVDMGLERTGALHLLETGRVEAGGGWGSKTQPTSNIPFFLGSRRAC